MTITPFADLLIWRLFSAALPFTKPFEEQRLCQKKNKPFRWADGFD
jgi:hypothetical protein